MIQLYSTNSSKDLPFQTLMGVEFGTSPSGERAPGATSLVNRVPKPSALRGLGVKAVVDWVIANSQEVAERSQSDPEGLREELLDLPLNRQSDALERGIQAHDAFETIANGGKPEGLTGDIRQMALQFWDFCEKWDIRFTAVELPVWNSLTDSCGVVDAIGVPRGDAAGRLKGRTVIFDWKTGALDARAALQLASYAAADKAFKDDKEISIPDVEAGVILMVTPTGWKAVPVAIGEVTVAGGSETVHLSQYLKAARELFDWETEVSQRVVFDPISAGAYKGEVEMDPEPPTRVLSGGLDGVKTQRYWRLGGQL